MIHVDHKAKDKSKYFSKVKIDGFPTNGVYSANDESFEAVPDIYNKDAITKLLTTDPSKLMKSKPKNVTSDYTDSLVPTPTTRAKLIQSGRNALKNIYTPVLDMNAPIPPKVDEDTVERDNAGKGTRAARPSKGGSLFQALVRAVKGLGPTTRRAKRKGSRTLKN